MHDYLTEASLHVEGRIRLCVYMPLSLTSLPETDCPIDRKKPDVSKVKAVMSCHVMATGYVCTRCTESKVNDDARDEEFVDAEV